MTEVVFPYLQSAVRGIGYFMLVLIPLFYVLKAMENGGDRGGKAWFFLLAYALACFGSVRFFPEPTVAAAVVFAALLSPFLLFAYALFFRSR
jgi:hypothetical protein